MQRRREIVDFCSMPLKKIFAGPATALDFLKPHNCVQLSTVFNQIFCFPGHLAEIVFFNSNLS